LSSTTSTRIIGSIFYHISNRTGYICMFVLFSARFFKTKLSLLIFQPLHSHGECVHCWRHLTNVLNDDETVTSSEGFLASVQYSLNQTTISTKRSVTMTMFCYADRVCSRKRTASVWCLSVSVCLSGCFCFTCTCSCRMMGWLSQAFNAHKSDPG